MNSIAQQAVTKGYGKRENFRAQPTSSSFFVEMYSKAWRRSGPTESGSCVARHGYSVTASRSLALYT